MLPMYNFKTLPPSMAPIVKCMELNARKLLAWAKNCTAHLKDQWAAMSWDLAAGPLMDERHDLPFKNVIFHGKPLNY
jgi:hypothetical protein